MWEASHQADLDQAFFQPIYLGTCEAEHCPHWFSCCCPQPSADTVKEVIQLSKDTLEKINKARMEGHYHEVSPGTSALLLHTHCPGKKACPPLDSQFMDETVKHNLV